MTSQSCPVCLVHVDVSERYPRYVCEACLERACDRADGGRRVQFSIGFLFGGIAGRYADTGDDYPHATCFVDGHACRAEPARFGGVVVQAVSPPQGLSPALS